MKWETILLSWIASTGLSSSLNTGGSGLKSSHNDIEKRQSGSLGGLLGGFVTSPVKKEKLEPLLRKNASRERLWFGPYNLPPINASTSNPNPKMPMQMDPNGVQINRALSGFCSDCTVLYGKAAIFYENGTKAGVLQGVYEHHIVMVDVTKRTMPFYLCEGQQGFLGTFPAAGFIVSGNDEAANYFTTPDGSFNSGYAIGTSSRMIMQAELVNYLSIAQKVYITAEYEYVPGQVADSDSTVSLFSVTGCQFPDYHVPKDKPQYNISSAKVPMPMDGFIINAKGHLHDGGVNVLLTLNDKIICDSQAKYGLDSRQTGSLAPNGKQWQVIAEMTQCTTPVPVKKGDILQMHTLYDNDLHPPRMAADGHSGNADQMGVIFLNFAVKKQSIT